MRRIHDAKAAIEDAERGDGAQAGDAGSDEDIFEGGSAYHSCDAAFELVSARWPVGSERDTSSVHMDTCPAHVDAQQLRPELRIWRRNMAFQAFQAFAQLELKRDSVGGFSIGPQVNHIRYLSELKRDFLASVGITYAVFRIAKSRLRHFGEFC